MVNRLLKLSNLLGKNHTAFLFGPRGVGKTSLAKAFLQMQRKGSCLELDLLNNDLFTRYIRRPGLFREEVESQLSEQRLLTVFVDEVQKLPRLLDEVHYLIEKRKGQVRFLLTGSSARKLKRGGANLLAGRAWTLHLHPLTHREGVTHLDRALQFGTLPAVYLAEDAPERTLRSYVETYLKEEIMQEALVRRVDGFVRFLDLAGQMNGEPANFTKIARDCGVTTKTAQDYFSILVDTLVAFRIDGWSHSVRKQLRQSPKYYWFDCGILNAIRGELHTELKESSYRYGKLFETWVVQEIVRLNDYAETDYRFHYWRTNTGLEVDLILSRSSSEPPLAIEIKSHTAPKTDDVRALESFRSENPKAKLWCLCRTPHSYKLGNALVLPWKEALARLFPA